MSQHSLEVTFLHTCQAVQLLAPLYYQSSALEVGSSGQVFVERKMPLGETRPPSPDIMNSLARMIIKRASRRDRLRRANYEFMRGTSIVDSAPVL